MTTYCDECGDEIVFRHVDGVLRPIHINGAGCNTEGFKARYVKSTPYSYSGSYLDSEDIGLIGSAETYLNPNAICPVCGVSVYFYYCPSGGAVFFDDVGWPWPKHPCTDTAQFRQVIPSAASARTRYGKLKDNNGTALTAYKLIEISEDGTEVSFKFVRIGMNTSFWATTDKTHLQKVGLTVGDFKLAPSFLITPKDEMTGTRNVGFISARLTKIVQIELKTRKPV